MDMLDALVLYGATPAGLVSLERDSPDLLAYASLVQARATEPYGDLAAVLAVYEWQGTPLLYLVDRATLDRSADKNRLKRLRRILAMRGDAPYLALVSPGTLEIYNLGLDRSSVNAFRVSDGLDFTVPELIIPTLATKRPNSRHGSKGWISSVILRLMGSAIDDLAQSGMAPYEAISLVGRALFVRFLGDRDLLPLGELEAGDASELFDHPKQVRQTNEWLDRTFNGDLLPVSAKTYSALTQPQCAILGDIGRRAVGGQLEFGWQEKWGDLNFAQIPVGVLSQAYEQHLKKYAKGRQEREGGFYTPRPIADLMVRTAMLALDQDSDVDHPVALDPAVGAGVFAITVFAALVAREWRRSGVRPDTERLRQILYGQIRGFDVNEAALRFAALGLYLVAIELDPAPLPVQKLRFAHNLRGKVLFRVGNPEDDEAPDLGSLGDSVGPEHDGVYDLVIGNPPWSSGTKLPGWGTVLDRVREVAATRIPILPPPPLPNEVLDLPFVWRAMSWAKPNGKIAFALHGRVLFQHGEGMDHARAALFGGLDVTGLINGADLRATDVWPTISTPFCILFANNGVPDQTSAFRFVSPRRELGLNNGGVMRIDALGSPLVRTLDVLTKPYLLKALYRGSIEDLGILERILGDQTKTLSSYWATRSSKPDIVAGSSTNALHRSGNGYQLQRPSSRRRKVNGELANETGVDASYLHGLPEITIEASRQTSIDTTGLPEFLIPRIHDRRPRELFEGPLLIVKKSPEAGTTRLRFAICSQDAVFNETFYGYSASQMIDGIDMVRYLTLVLGSQTAMWLALMLSGEFGVEREVIEKKTIDGIPFPPFERMTKEQRAEASELFGRLAERPDQTWLEVDAWVNRLYGLDEWDVETISETLRLSLPYADVASQASSPVDRQGVVDFCRVFADELGEIGRSTGLELSVTPLPDLSLSEWRGLEVKTAGTSSPPLDSHPAYSFTELADDLAATEIVVRAAPGVLHVTRLGHHRYWSKTKARMCARSIAWRHLDFLDGADV